MAVDPATLLTILQLVRMGADLAARAAGGQLTEEEIQDEMVDMQDHLASANERFTKAATELRETYEE